jgi:epoxyqueuosine reductase
MKYLEGEKMDLRQSVKNYFPEFKSAFSFLFDYRSDKKILKNLNTEKKIGGYAFGFEGKDYHHHIWDSLNAISEKYFSNYKVKVVCDTAPILDRELAYRCGLGWFGKNSMLINRFYGSYVMIGHILVDRTFNVTTKQVETDHCGQCTRCIAACPTDAIDPVTRTVNSNDCIPFFTIEKFKDDEPPPHAFSSMDEIFGCDICQEVCPWNDRSLKYVADDQNILTEGQEKIKKFFLEKPTNELKSELESISKKQYVRDWKGTSFERTGRDGIIKNLKWKNKKD